MNNTLTMVLIPLRVDSVERLENLLCVIKYLIKLDLYIFIYEADYNNNGIVSKLLPRTKKILWYVLKISFQLFLAMAQGIKPKDAQKQQKQWKIIISDLVIIRTYLNYYF